MISTQSILVRKTDITRVFPHSILAIILRYEHQKKKQVGSNDAIWYLWSECIGDVLQSRLARLAYTDSNTHTDRQ